MFRSLLSTPSRFAASTGKLAGSVMLSGLMVTSAVGMSLATVSSAQAAAVPSVRKMALVDLQRVLQQTKQGKAARSKLEKSFKSKQKKLDSQRSKLEADQKKIAGLSGQAQEKAFAELQQKAQELQAMYMTLQQELASQEAELIEKIYVNCQKIVAGMASELGVDLVLVRSEQTVLFSDKRLDITSALIKRYDKAHAK